MRRVVDRPAFGPEIRRAPDLLTLEEMELAAHSLSRTLLPSSLARGRRLAVDPERALGTKDSAHGVFFVQATNGHKRHDGQVYAVKRFRGPDDAERELHAMEAVRARGFNTLNPVGDRIHHVDGIGSLLVTEYVPRFTTMNHLGWRDSYAGQPGYDRRLARPLQGMARFAASLHSAGVVHNDLQVKNVAQDGIGRYITFDLEGAHIVEPNEINDLGFVGEAGEDMAVLIKSLVARGYLWNSTDATFVEEVNNNVVDPYLDATGIENQMLIEYLGTAINEGLVARASSHGDFSSRMGLPS